MIEWLKGESGKGRGVNSNKVIGGGDSVGRDITAAVRLWLRDEGKMPLSAQVLLYLEARI